MTTSKPLPDLKIRLKRRPDDSAAITCVREDGSVTWQRQEGSVGQVFPAQDLTHYSVETTFGYLYVATRGDRASLPELTDESLNRGEGVSRRSFYKVGCDGPGRDARVVISTRRQSSVELIVDSILESGTNQIAATITKSASDSRTSTNARPIATG